MEVDGRNRTQHVRLWFLYVGIPERNSNMEQIEHEVQVCIDYVHEKCKIHLTQGAVASYDLQEWQGTCHQGKNHPNNLATDRIQMHSTCLYVRDLKQVPTYFFHTSQGNEKNHTEIAARISCLNPFPFWRLYHNYQLGQSRGETR